MNRISHNTVIVIRVAGIIISLLISILVVRSKLPDLVMR